MVAVAAKKKTKSEFTRCPHCPQRYGSEETLTAHVHKHRREHRAKLIPPEHHATLHPANHTAMLKSILKRAGHG